MASNLEPIPIPAHLRWREFKIRILPLLVFAIVSALAIMVWRSQLGPRGYVGQVELKQSAIGSPNPVTVVEVLVKPHQAVKAGDPLVVVTATDPKLLETTVAAIRAEADALRQSLDVIRPQQQMLLDFERLHLDSLNLQVQLSVSRVESALAESEYVRAAALARDRIISEEEVERLKAIRDARKIEVEELTSAVGASKAGVDSARPVRDSIRPETVRNSVESSLVLYDKKVAMIEAELGKIVLRSPRDGIVGLIHFQPGSIVPTGLPILSVADAKPEYVVAFIRQPLRRKIEPGMAVELRSRAGDRAGARSTIETVGAHLEPVNSTLYPVGTVDARFPELGLPIRVPIPEGFAVLPGETVEVVVGI